MRKLLAWLAGICLAAAVVTGAFCEGPALEDVGLELAGSSLRFPAVTGMEDEALQAQSLAAAAYGVQHGLFTARINAFALNQSRAVIHLFKYELADLIRMVGDDLFD